MIMSIVEGITKGVVGPLAGVFNKKLDTDLEKYKVDGQVDTNLINAKVKLVEAQSKVFGEQIKNLGFRMLQYGLIFPVVVWFNCIIVDSIYFHSQSIQALPQNLEYLPHAVVGYLLLNAAFGGFRK